MVRQWQEFFYESNYEATPLVSPDFVKLADAHGIGGRAVTKRSDVTTAVNEARTAAGAFLLNFMVEKEDSVYPMIPAGNALHAKTSKMSRFGTFVQVHQEMDASKGER